MNEMTVRVFVYGSERFTVSGEGYRRQGQIVGQGDVGANLMPLLVPLVSCNDSRVADGRATVIRWKQPS